MRTLLPYAVTIIIVQPINKVDFYVKFFGPGGCGSSDWATDQRRLLTELEILPVRATHSSTRRQLFSFFLFFFFAVPSAGRCRCCNHFFAADKLANNLASYIDVYTAKKLMKRRSFKGCVSSREPIEYIVYIFPC